VLICWILMNDCWIQRQLLYNNCTNRTWIQHSYMYAGRICMHCSSQTCHMMSHSRLTSLNI